MFLHPASYLTLTANLTLAPFLQKHLTLCENLASISLLLLPQTGIISISRQHCQTAACVRWALPGTTVAPFFWAKGQWPLVAHHQETLFKFYFKVVLPGMWTKPISSFNNKKKICRKKIRGRMETSLVHISLL